MGQFKIRFDRGVGLSCYLCSSVQNELNNQRFAKKKSLFVLLQISSLPRPAKKYIL
jgi:hypothetical protein